MFSFILITITTLLVIGLIALILRELEEANEITEGIVYEDSNFDKFISWLFKS